MSEEKPKTDVTKAATYDPSRGYVLGTRIFEIICGLVTMATLAYTAKGHSDIDGSIPGWVVLGLVVSCVGSVVSSIFVLDPSVKYSLISAFISILLSAAYLVYVVYGAMNTNAYINCYTDYTESKEQSTCASPKAAEFFAFVAMFAYGFSAATGVLVWRSRRTSVESETSQA